MIVDGGDIETAFPELGHDWVDLGLEQNKVAHHHGPAMRRLECNPASQRERRLDGDAVDHDVEVAAGKTVPMDVADGDGGLPAERRVNLFPRSAGRERQY